MACNASAAPGGLRLERLMPGGIRDTTGALRAECEIGQHAKGQQPYGHSGSPTARRVVKASGLGRVTMVEMPALRSGVVSVTL